MGWLKGKNGDYVSQLREMLAAGWTGEQVQKLLRWSDEQYGLVMAGKRIIGSRERALVEKWHNRAPLAALATDDETKTEDTDVPQAEANAGPEQPAVPAGEARPRRDGAGSGPVGQPHRGRRGA
ncbi:MAG: hypothetical protein AMXMBFR64_60800 [Myxococcales bacterium]